MASVFGGVAVLFKLNASPLDMLPAYALPARPGSWALEVSLACTNTIVMSDNVRADLESRGVR